MSSSGPAPVFEFGDFVLDVAAYELRRGSRRVRLERQPLDLLVLLVERRGQLVSHEEIASRLWGEGVFVEVATGIHSAIRKIRRALRDDAEAPRFVESVARRGYRFVAPVRVAAASTSERETRLGASPAGAPLAGARSDSPAGPPPAPAPPGRATRWTEALGARRSRTAVASLLLALVAGFSAWSWLGTHEPSDRVRLAVLPFENLSPEADLDYLVHGLAEETIAVLGQADPARMSVVGRTSTRRFEGSGASAAEIGQTLGADYLVEGSLRAEPERLRLTVKLIRVRGELQDWAASFDRERRDLLGLERELATAVAEQIELRLSPAQAAAMRRRETGNPAAHELYLKGRYLADLLQPAALIEAIGSFEAAVEIDPQYALAWAGIARAHSTRPINSDHPPLESWRHARRAAARAVEIRPDLADAQVALARVAFFDWEWPTAEAALRRALSVDPDHAEAHLMLGHLLSQQGRQGQARAEMARARELDPLSPINHALSAQVAYQARDFESAVEHSRRALELAPGFWIAYMQLGQALERLGEPQPALAALAEAIRLSGVNSKPVALTGYILARTGRVEAAREVLARLHETAASRYVPPCAMALVHAGLEERDVVFEWLERAYDVRDVHVVFLPVDPKWDPHRGDPRFQDLLARAGLRPARPAQP